MGLQNIPRGKQVSHPVDIRRGWGCDANYVRDIDLKSYQYPWGRDKWKILDDGKLHHWCVALVQNRPVGFAVWKDSLDEAEILRLGVNSVNQRQGIGTLILGYIRDYARRQQLKSLSTVVPEINCFPGHPDDVSYWLMVRGFRAKTPIIKNYAYMYGQWVDGFYFQRSIQGG